MPDASVLALPLPDARARTRIANDLETNLLVEAGAGSGKTTELVNRMVALVATGTAQVDEIAAVTFTRKAAGELRERVQARLERAAAEAEDGSEAAARLRQALTDLDRAFIGTIHAFCARLLRERPLEVGLDPAFQEIPVEERARMRRRYWEGFLERLVRDGDPLLEELGAAGLRPAQLFGLFETLVENPDVAFPVQEAALPSASDLARVRTTLEEIVEQGVELMPEREPDPSWDSLQKKLRTLAFTREVTGWKEPADFFEALERICKPGPKGHTVVQKRWRSKPHARELRDRVDAFAVGPDAPANRVLHGWYAHRYALALRLARRAAEDFAEYRRRTGRLDFQDLLLLTARLLRTDAGARAELGSRYRRLLVDEFQDTDPLQAEIMLLLASEPTAGPGGGEPGEDQHAGAERNAAEGRHAGEEGNAGEGGDGGEEHEAAEADWRLQIPRPGALFVVGDPKQSIYRFRRADILLYELVKNRFRSFGGVIELTSNFRSRPPIGDLVNQLFAQEAFFPSAATAYQARFEPLNTRPSQAAPPAEGVFWYGVSSDAGNRAAVTLDDAARVASWIAARVEAKERSPGDFMILTRTTHYLASYARALEARSVPVQVTGAGVGVEEELEELIGLLTLMVDPANPVKVVAALLGLFFGLDFERLTAHRLEGGALDVVRPGDRGDPEVLEALRTLHGWWRAATREPADVFLTRVVTELGLLPYAAAGDLGSIRAGALVFALDTVRAAALAGDASLPGAVDALRAALDLREAEAPLEPGRPDVVRVMNVHQAKGLEAPVVILADPSRLADRAPDFHVERDEGGRAVGHLLVSEAGEGFRGDRLLARPTTWEEKAAEEARFAAAEDVRLLYVAVTRPRDELVVARTPERDGSVWGPLDPWLTEHATELSLEGVPPAISDPVHLSPEDAGRRVAQAAGRLADMKRPTYRHVSVTEVAKAADLEATAAGGGGEELQTEGFRGYSWGSAVHAALAVAAGEVSDPALQAACRMILVEHDRPLDDHGEPVELDELVALVRTVRTSELWRRAEASGRVLAEVPFAAPGRTRPPTPPAPETVQRRPASGGERRQLDLFGGGGEATQQPASRPEPELPEATPSVLEGVIDLVFKERDGWVIADYKTDVGTDPDFPRRLTAYRRQVELYADAWARLTGERVKERVLFFTTQGTVESW